MKKTKENSLLCFTISFSEQTVFICGIFKKKPQKMLWAVSYTNCCMLLLLNTAVHTPKGLYVPWFCPFIFKILRTSHLLLCYQAMILRHLGFYKVHFPSLSHVLPFHASTAVPNINSFYFQTETMQAFSKTFPSVIYRISNFASLLP